MDKNGLNWKNWQSEKNWQKWQKLKIEELDKGEEIEKIVSQILLNQDYNIELYDKLVELNFELFKNKLLEQINNIIDLLICYFLLAEALRKFETVQI